MASKKEGEEKLELAHTENKVVSRAKLWHNPVYVTQQDCSISKKEGRQPIKKKPHLLSQGFWEKGKGLVM